MYGTGTYLVEILRNLCLSLIIIDHARHEVYNVYTLHNFSAARTGSKFEIQAKRHFIIRLDSELTHKDKYRYGSS
jgi:hypothetical protein